MLLSTKSHHLLEGFRKQQERFVGPYVVKEKVHPNAYRLAGLPAGVPTTQNVRFLIKFHRSPEQFSSRPDPDSSAPELIEGQYEWEVEGIVDHRDTRAGMMYLVKWKGFARKQWLGQENMENSKDLLREYHQRRGLLLTSFLDPDSDDAEDTPNTSPNPSSPPDPALDFTFSPPSTPAKPPRPVVPPSSPASPAYGPALRRSPRFQPPTTAS